MDLRFWVKAYATGAGAFFGSAGQTVPVYCNHFSEGEFGMNATGQVVPLPNVTSPTTNPPGGPKKVGVPHATEFPNANQAFLTLKSVTKIKDMVTMTEYYVDTDDYNTKKVQCNPVPYASACADASGLSAGTPGATSATITWTNNPASAGIEYINNTSGTTPVIDGTFLLVGTNSVAITGLTTATSYHFWIRTICPGGVRSAWVSLTYTTA